MTNIISSRHIIEVDAGTTMFQLRQKLESLLGFNPNVYKTAWLQKRDCGVVSSPIELPSAEDMKPLEGFDIDDGDVLSVCWEGHPLFNKEDMQPLLDRLKQVEDRLELLEKLIIECGLAKKVRNSLKKEN